MFFIASPIKIYNVFFFKNLILFENFFAINNNSDIKQNQYVNHSIYHKHVMLYLWKWSSSWLIRDHFYNQKILNYSLFNY